MDHVMAVHYVPAVKIGPIHVDLDFIVGQQRSNIAPIAAHENWNLDVFAILRTRKIAVRRMLGDFRSKRDKFFSAWIVGCRCLNFFPVYGPTVYLLQNEFGEVGVYGMGPIL